MCKGEHDSVDEVILTRNEVAHARRNWIDLAVVTGIKLARTKDQPKASGGILTRRESVKPTQTKLTPLTYAFELPSTAPA